MKIFYDSQEILYKGHYVPMRLVKKRIIKEFPSLVSKYQIKKRFNSKTGEIERMYAWDSIFYTLEKSGDIDLILNKLLND